MEVRENPPQSNQISSPIFTYAPINSSNETQDDQPHLNLHQRNHYPDPDPVPVEPVSQTPPQLDNVVAPAVARYRECLKNHAVNMGSHVLDGCGEFMANGEEGTPESLKCAACECHRSFHRREEAESHPATWMHAMHNKPPPRATTMQPRQQYNQHNHHRYTHQVPAIMMAFGGTGVVPMESSSEDLEQKPSKKRFRTKFTDEQKERMHDFAERIGWTIQKNNDQMIMQFCNEVGLKRKVFKVWMHNCKQASKKKQHE